MALLYSIQSAADELAISYRQMCRLLEAGEIPYVRQGTRRFIKAADLIAYVQSL